MIFKAKIATKFMATNTDFAINAANFATPNKRHLNATTKRHTNVAKFTLISPAKALFAAFIIILTFSSTALLAVERPKFEDFAACLTRNKASVMTYEGMQAFVLSENLLAVLKTPTQKLNKYVKYDPFLNLYLVRTDFSLFPPPKYNEQNLTRNDWVGIIDPQHSYIGHIKYLANSLDERDQLDFPTKIGQLDTPCCSMLGIALGDSSFIGNRYLRHFARYNDVYWGDVGVDFAMRDERIFVEAVRNNGQFLINDEIISVDGVPAKDLRKLNESILFSDKGATMYFHILRDNRDLNITTNVFAKDLSRFKLPENVTSAVKKPAQASIYRSPIGLTLNRNLVVTRIQSGSKAELAGFKVGDKVLRINNEILRTLKRAQDLIASQQSLNFLVAREEKNLPFPKKHSITQKGDGIFNFFIRVEK